mgnify:CR=1 FL=1
MLKSYLPPRFNTLAIVLFVMLWLFSFYKILGVLLLAYIVLYVSLRRSRNDFRDDPVVTKGVIFSPSNGKVVHIEHNVSHGMYGDQLIEIQIMIPWWKEMGINLPLSSEVKMLHVLKGQSFLRTHVASEVIGTKEGKGVSLALDNRGEHNVSHGMYGDQLIEIQIMIPWWKEMGINLPLSSEVKMLHVLKGQSFLRTHVASEVIGTKEGKGVSLALDNRGETVGLTFFKCKLGLWPELMVMPGDRGGRRVNIGYFPFGGTVMLYLPKKYEILVKTNDEITCGETIIAVIPDHA